jgi:type IX secretion system substrate protein
MKRLILITGAIIYLFFILICFAANAQQANANGPLVHIHTVKDFRGKVTVKDTSFRMDTAKMHAMMMHKRPHHFGKDSAMRKHPKMDSAMLAHRKTMMQQNGNGQAWAGHRGRLKNADSISINRKITIRGDSMIRDTRRIVYFKPSPGKNYKSADTVLQYNVTVHKGMKPGAPDITNPQELNELINGGNTGSDIGALNVTDLNIYPNPSNGQFKINFTLPDNSPIGLKITDMEGKTVWSDAVNNFTGRYNSNIDLSAQPKAVYILEIMQNNKTMLKKLVIN